VDGVGDVMGSLRDQIPVREGTRAGVTTAGPGESTYLDYDEQIAEHACRWLEEAAGQEQPPWVLFVSFVCPHPPFVAPPELYDLYPLDQIPMPVQYAQEERPMHPAIADLRRTMQYDQPFSEEEVRRVTAAYYGACTHLDLQVGKVLEALQQNGFDDQTRIIYTSDHGENMGCRGLWGKFTMYEESVGVPFIMAGADVPTGEVCHDLVSLVDCHPTILDAVGLEPEATDVPGQSLWPIAAGQAANRVAFSEYHAVGSRGASYMLRKGSHKLIHYVEDPPQLFDLAADPLETVDLAADAQNEELLESMRQELAQVVDVEAADARAKADQEALVNSHGGREAVLERGTFVNSPAPGETPTFRSPTDD
ncbi:MAG: sulfatase-like hydrolase/transferase, partial [Planctomycetota bacterium]|nr:sulfatase-like hydrolase/transferase [Planctomycetota bacterium]